MCIECVLNSLSNCLKNVHTNIHYFFFSISRLFVEYLAALYCRIHLLIRTFCETGNKVIKWWTFFPSSKNRFFIMHYFFFIDQSLDFYLMLFFYLVDISRSLFVSEFCCTFYLGYDWHCAIFKTSIELMIANRFHMQSVQQTIMHSQYTPNLCIHIMCMCVSTHCVYILCFLFESWKPFASELIIIIPSYTKTIERMNRNIWIYTFKLLVS